MNSGCGLGLSCLIRPPLLASSRDIAQLESQRTKTLQDIQCLFPQARTQNRATGWQFRIGVIGPPSYQFISPDTKIIELDLSDITANYGRAPLGGRGLYDVEKGKIILVCGNWCRETLIHETLHSVSFSAVSTSFWRYINLFEGLTEFFTGYILYGLYPECFAAWKEQRYHECAVTYASFVKLLSAFCRFLRIQDLLPVYFWNGTNNWNAQFAQLIDTIHQAGYPGFQDFRLRPGLTIETRFMDQCLNNFGKVQFKNTYESPLSELLDFAQMLP